MTSNLLLLDRLCRACATNVEEHGQEDAWRRFQTFRHLYSNLADLKVSDDDNLPKRFCTTCTGLLQSFENFKATCVQSITTIQNLTAIKEEPIEEVVSAEILPLPQIKVEKLEVEPECAPEPGTEKRKRRKPKSALLPSEKKVRKKSMCALCGSKYKFLKSLRHHMETTHLNPKPKYECPKEECGKKFMIQKTFDAHMRKHEDETMSKWCSHCNKHFQNAKVFRRHLQKVQDSVNLQVKTTYKDNVSVVCEVCGDAFRYKSALIKHIQKKHQAKRPFECHHCGKGFVTKHETMKHLFYMHTNRGLITCNICGAQVKQLMEHCQRIHTVWSMEKIHECEICHSRFMSKQTLHVHSKSHTGIRNHECKVCGKRFARANLLKAHTYVHSGERPVHCEYCGNGFYHKYALNIHMNIHRREWIAQGHTGIELVVYPTSNKSKNSNERKYANVDQTKILKRH